MKTTRAGVMFVWKRFLRFFSRAAHSYTTRIIVLLILVAAIPLTVVLSQKSQDIRQRASESADAPACDSNQVTMSFSPQTVRVGDQFTLSFLSQGQGTLFIQDTLTPNLATCSSFPLPFGGTTMATCTATAQGAFTWTHLWRNCNAQDASACQKVGPNGPFDAVRVSTQCSKLVNFTIAPSLGVPLSTTIPTARLNSAPTEGTAGIAFPAGTFRANANAGSGKTITASSIVVIKVDDNNNPVAPSLTNYACTGGNSLYVGGNGIFNGRYCFIAPQQTGSQQVTLVSREWTPTEAGTYLVVTDAINSSGKCTGKPFGLDSSTNDLGRCDSGNLDFVRIVVKNPPSGLIQKGSSAATNRIVTTTAGTPITAGDIKATVTAGEGKTLAYNSIYIVKVDGSNNPIPPEQTQFACDPPNEVRELIDYPANPTLRGRYCFINTAAVKDTPSGILNTNAWTPTETGTYLAIIDNLDKTATGLMSKCAGSPFGSDTPVRCDPGSPSRNYRTDYLTLNVNSAVPTCNVAFNIPPGSINPGDNVPITLTFNAHTPTSLSDSDFWQYSTLYEVDNNNNVVNNFGGCPNNVCTFRGNVNTTGTHKIRFAVRDNDTYGSGHEIAGQTGSKIWCTTTGTETFTTGNAPTPTSTAIPTPTGTTTPLPSPIPAPSSISAVCGNNLILRITWPLVTGATSYALRIDETNANGWNPTVANPGDYIINNITTSDGIYTLNAQAGGVYDIWIHSIDNRGLLYNSPFVHTSSLTTCPAAPTGLPTPTLTITPTDRPTPTGTLAPLRSDVNQDTCLDIRDFNEWVYAYRNHGTPRNARFRPDVDKNGVVDIRDFNIWLIDYRAGDRRCTAR